jgi:hypothetical protein
MLRACTKTSAPVAAKPPRPHRSLRKLDVKAAKTRGRKFDSSKDRDDPFELLVV